MARILALLVLLLFSASASAQDGYPLPAYLTPITPTNAAQIQKLATLGSEMPGALVWSLSGETLAVATTGSVSLYAGDALTESLHTFPTGNNVAFESDDVLIIDGQRWDIKTGESLGAVPAPATKTIRSPSGKYEVRPLYEDDSLTLLLKKADGEEIRLSIGNGYDFERIVFSPDEQYAILILQHFSYGSSYPALQLWNVEHGKFVATLPHTLEILTTANFHAGGKIIVTSATTDAVYGNIFEEVGIWNGRTGELIGPELWQGMLPVYFSPDARLFAYFTAFTGEKISVWTDHEIGTLAYDYGFMNTGTMPELVFSPDSRTLITNTAESSQLLFWNVSTEPLPAKPFMALQTEANVSALLTSPDGTRLISIETDGIIEVWDAITGERLARTRADHLNYRTSLSPDGRWLRTGRWDDQTLLFDIETLKLLLAVPNEAAWNSDWTKVAYWNGGNVHIEATLTGQKNGRQIVEGYLGTTAAYNPKTVLAVFTQETFQGYNLSTGQVVFSYPLTEKGWPQVIFSDDGQYFLTNVDSFGYRPNGSQSIQLWDVTRLEQPVSEFDVPDRESKFLIVPDSRLLSALFSGCGDGGGGYYALWDMETGTRLIIWAPGGCGPYDHAFTPDGKQLIVAWSDMVSLIDTHKAIETSDISKGGFYEGTRGVIYASGFKRFEHITLSPDGETLAVHVIARQVDEPSKPAYDNHWIDLYQLSYIIAQGAQQEPVREASVRIPGATKAVFSPDGQWLLTDNGFWEVHTGEQRAAVGGAVAAFNPDGTVLAVASQNNVTLWDTAALAEGKENVLAVLNVRDVKELGFSPDSALLYLRRTGDVQSWGIPANSH